MAASQHGQNSARMKPQRRFNVVPSGLSPQECLLEEFLLMLQIYVKAHYHTEYRRVNKLP